jgi:hypothetical protein
VVVVGGDGHEELTSSGYVGGLGDEGEEFLEGAALDRAEGPRAVHDSSGEEGVCVVEILLVQAQGSR